MDLNINILKPNNYIICLDSFVWGYFYPSKNDANKVRCFKCSDELSKYTKTLSRHLQTHDIFKPESVQNPLTKQPKLQSFPGTTISEECLGKEMLLVEKNRIDNLLTMAIASSTTPHIFVENKYLRMALKLLNPSYRIISRNQVSKNISSLYSSLVSKMQIEIERLSSFSLCIDFWSKNTIGFLGITLNFLNGHKMDSILLILKQVDFPHTSKVVLDETNDALNSWKINGLEDERITYILTDNGSNMVKAYNKIEGLFRTSHEPIVETTDINFIDESNSEFEDDDSSDDADNSIDTQLVYQKRLPCVAHSINNTIKTSIEGSIRNHISECYELTILLKKIKTIIKKIQYSGRCMDYLRSNKVYTYLPPQTRWIYQLEMVNLIQKYNEHYKHCCESILGIDYLVLSEIEKIAVIKDVLELFNVFIRKIEADKTVSISLVLPQLLKIKTILKKKADNDILDVWVKNLLKDIDYRFKFALDSNSDSFQIIYALATFLDPRYHFIMKKKEAKHLYSKVMAFLEEIYAMPVEQVKDLNDSYGELSDDEQEISSFDEIKR